MTKTEIKEIREELDRVLEEFGKKHQMMVSVGTITYDANGFRTKISATRGTSEEEVSRTKWNKSCILFGLTEQDYGKEVKAGGRQFRLIGFNTRAHKYPLIGEDIDNGQTFKLPRHILS